MRQALRYTLITTLPVLFGYLFLGIAFGLLLQRAGYSAFWAFGISTFVYAGSMQFVLIGFLTSPISLVTVLLMTLSINSRHMFYGLSFIDTFKHMGKAYPYMIFSLTDETYSLLCGSNIPSHLNEKKTMLLISVSNHFYWIMGSIIGSLIGELILFDTTGIDFAMTALFVVIFVEQWLSNKHHRPAITGLTCGITSLLLFGPNAFILPALISTITLLLLFKKSIENSSNLAEVSK